MLPLPRNVILVFLPPPDGMCVPNAKALSPRLYFTYCVHRFRYRQALLIILTALKSRLIVILLPSIGYRNLKKATSFQGVLDYEMIFIISSLRKGAYTYHPLRIPDFHTKFSWLGHTQQFLFQLIAVAHTTHTGLKRRGNNEFVLFLHYFRVS